MSNSTKQGFDMIEKQTHKYVPQLRFPDFADSGEWEVKRLGEILTVNSGKDYKHLNLGDVPVYGTGGYMLSVDDKLSDVDAVGIGRKGTIDKPQYLKAPFWTVDTLFFLTAKEGYDLHFIFFLLQTIEWKKYAEQTGVPSLTRSSIEKIEVIIPSLKEQQRIAQSLLELDSLISTSNEKLELLKAHKKGLMQQLLAPINGGGNSYKPLEELFEIRNGYTPSKANPNYWENGIIPWFRMEDIRKNGHILSDAIQHVTPSAIKGKGLFPAYSIIVATTATIGEHALIIADSLANQRFTFLSKRKSFEDKLDMLYFHYYMFLVDEWCKNNTNSGGLLSVNMSAFKRLMIPLPPINEQKKIANALSSSDKVIDGYSDKIEMLRHHKRALMQQLFPKA